MMANHNHIRGLHHVTAIASGAQANVELLYAGFRSAIGQAHYQL